MKSSRLKLPIRSGIALVTLLLSLGLWIFFCWPEVNAQFPFAIAMEFWPYFLCIPALGLGIRLSSRRLRQQRLGLSLAALMLVVNASPYLYWLGLPALGPHPEGLRVMSYNVWVNNRDYPGIQQSIQQENPDILFLTEVSVEAMAELQSRLDYPYSQRTTVGTNAFFSRYPLLSVTPEYPHVTDHGQTFSLVAQIQTDQDVVTVIGFHPPTPLSRSSFAVRNQQFERLSPYLRQLQGRVIVLGDFNTSPWSPYFEQFEKNSDLSIVTRGRWIWATWSFKWAWPDLFAKIPIDHVAIRGFDCVGAWTGDANGSDHRPIIAVLKSS